MIKLTALQKRMRAAMIEVALDRTNITYTDFGARFGITPDMEFHFHELAGNIGAVSQFESERGRPMLSCLVVRADEKMMPGRGFFDLAFNLGRMKFTPDDADNRLKFQISELRAVYEHWAGVAKKGFKIKVRKPTKRG